jgi:hypothetical protein
MVSCLRGKDTHKCPISKCGGKYLDMTYTGMKCLGRTGYHILINRVIYINDY